MPRKILKPRSLNFDPDASVGIRPSFEPKLLFALLAFKLCWKSTHRNALTGIRRRLNTPIGVSILSQPVEGIDMAPVKSPNRVFKAFRRDGVNRDGSTLSDGRSRAYVGLWAEWFYMSKGYNIFWKIS